jgi:hypothetical protein
VPPKVHIGLDGQVTPVMSISVNGKAEPISGEYYQDPWLGCLSSRRRKNDLDDSRECMPRCSILEGRTRS